METFSELLVFCAGNSPVIGPSIHVIGMTESNKNNTIGVERG